MVNTDSEAQSHLINLVIYACSILRSGIAVPPINGRSNDELLRALSITLDAALPQVGSPGPSTAHRNGASEIPAHAEEEDDGCWAVIGGSDEGLTTVQIPDPAVDLASGGIGVGLEDCCKEAQRLNLDVTAKFFYLAPPSSGDPRVRFDPAWTTEAAAELERATGLETIDTLIVSLPGMTYDDLPVRGCESDVNATETVPEVTDQEMLDIWRALSSNDRIFSLGVSEFSKTRLERLYAELPPEPSTSGAPNGNAAHHSLRRPRVNQINTRTEVPDDLRSFAKAQSLQLFTHSDCSDILPSKTFALLLNKYAHRLPEPLIDAIAKASTPSAIGDAGQRDVRLQPQWVLKYTVVIKDRSVVADKGYIVKVSSV